MEIGESIDVALFVDDSEKHSEEDVPVAYQEKVFCCADGCTRRRRRRGREYVRQQR